MVRSPLLFTFFLLIPAISASVGLRDLNVEDEYDYSMTDPSAAIEVIKTKDDSATPVDLRSEIESATGIQVNSIGSIDSFSTVMIRGASSSGTDIFLNGIRLNSAINSVFDLSLIPDELIDHVEIYKGYSPVALGLPNLGGVINIVTRRGNNVDDYGFKLSCGSFATLNLNGFTSGSNKDSDYLISFYLRRTDGDFEFVNHNGTPDNKEDDRIERRKNNFRNEYAISFGSVTRIGELYRLNLFFMPYFSNGGIAGVENIKTENASYKTLRNVFSIENQFILQRPLNMVMAGYSNIYSNTAFDDRYGELNPASADLINTSLIRHNIYLLTDLIFFNNYLILRFSFSDEVIDRTNTFHSDNYFTGNRREYSLHIEDNIELIADRLFLIPSFGIKAIDDNVKYSSIYLMEGDTSISNERLMKIARGGLFLRLSDELNIRMGISSVQRYPDIYEMFGDGVYIQPNPRLTSEEGRLFDSGIELDIVRVYISYTLFFNRYENLIQFWQNSQRTIKADNISRAEIYGSELRVRPYIHKGLLTIIGYTHQEPINKTNIPSIKDKILPFRYTDSVNIRLGVIRSTFNLIYDYRYTSQNFFDSPNLLPVGGTTGKSIHNITFDYKVSAIDSTVSLEISNITDRQVEDIAGYPLPGRMFYLGIQKIFKQPKQEGGKV